MAKSSFYNITIGANGRNISELVTRFTFTKAIDEDNKLEIQLYDKNLALVDDDDLVQGAVLQFYYGYIGSIQSTRHTAVINDPEVNYASRIDITLVATDKGQALKKGTSNKVWKGQTLSDIVKQIASANGLTADVTPTTKVYDSLPQGNRTDMDFLDHLTTLADGGTYQAHINGSILTFKPRDLKQESSITFTYGDPNSGIISFRPVAASSGETGSRTSTSVVGINPLTNEPFNSEVNNEEANKQDALGEGYVAYNRNAIRVGNNEIKRTGKQVPTATDDPVEAENMASKVKNDAEMEGLTATLSIEMNPGLEPGSIITMAGVGKRHRGNWYVVKIVDDITGGAAKSTLSLKKNATDKPVTSASDDATDVNSTVGPDTKSTDAVVFVYDANSNAVKD